MTTVSITHPQLVAALVKPPIDIIQTLSPFTTDLWHGATGVSGEAGELLEAILFPPTAGIDRVNLREELGDLYFYIEQIVQRSGVVIDWDGLDAVAELAELTPDRQLHYAACIAVHGSQVLDTVKKAAIYNKGLDVELLTNQVNALVLSMTILGLMFGLSRQECLNGNIVKLSKRYASLSYSDAQAQERADKRDGTVPERKYFSGQAPELPAETADVVQRPEPRTSDMDNQVQAEKSSLN